MLVLVLCLYCLLTACLSVCVSVCLSVCLILCLFICAASSRQIDKQEGVYLHTIHLFKADNNPGCRFAPVCIDAETIIKGVEEGQLAVRRALTPYAGSVPPAATSDAPQGSSKASEIYSLDSLETLAAAELTGDLGSKEGSADDCEAVDQTKLQEQYEFLVQQRTALQEQLEKLKQGK